MTATNHIATGALIGTVIGKPWLAFPVAFLSHFLLDALPHFGTEAPNVLARNADPLFRRVLTGDVILSVVTLTLLVYGRRWVPLLCGLVAYAPDVAWLYRGYFENKTGVHKQRNWFNEFHRRIQRYEKRWGIYVEATFFIGVGAVIWKTF